MKSAIPEQELYFSIGGHPAFKVPLLEGYNLRRLLSRVQQKETSMRWSVSPDGLIDENLIDGFDAMPSIMPMKKEFFRMMPCV